MGMEDRDLGVGNGLQPQIFHHVLHTEEPASQTLKDESTEKTAKDKRTMGQVGK